MSLPDVLARIVATKKLEVAALEPQRAALAAAALACSRSTRSMRSAILEAPGLAVISECKKASPSVGVIEADYRPAEMAACYEKAGAAAISCLTDRDYFQGCAEDLKAVRAAVKIPVLRKDFVIDEVQIDEARIWGADAFLLIAAILSVEEMKRFIAHGRRLGLDALVEVHDEAEMRAAAAAGAEIVGVNNRDLRSFQVDLGLTCRLAPFAPKGAPLVGESGIKTPADARQLEACGCRAILVGESLMRQGPEGCGRLLKELAGLPAEK